MSAVLDGLALALQPTNLLALVALGLLAGGKGMGAGIWFAAGLLVGSLAIASALRDPPATFALLAVAAIAGIIVAVGWQPPLLVVYALVFAGGTALALNAPPQAATVPAAVASQVTTGIGALIVFAMVSSIASLSRMPWHGIALRVAGSWIVASAILVLALRLAR
jgi:urease accessory protein